MAAGARAEMVAGAASAGPSGISGWSGLRGLLGDAGGVLMSVLPDGR